MRYVALLRGINLGGKTMVKMLERKLKIPLAARNWRTVEKLAELKQ